MSKATPPPSAWQDLYKNQLKAFRKYKGTAVAYNLWGVTKETIENLRLSAFFDGSKQPQGLAFPNFRGDELYGIVIGKWDNTSNSKLVEGGTDLPFLFRQTNTDSLPIIIVPNPLDGVILYQEASDLLEVVALGSDSTTVDEEIHTLLNKSSRVIFCADYTKSGLALAQSWQEKYPHIEIISTPAGINVREFFIFKGKIRSWVTSIISERKHVRRVCPSIEFIEVNVAQQVEEILQNIKTDDRLTGIDIQEGLIGLSPVEDKRYLFNLSKIPPETLQNLSELRLISYESNNIIEKLKPLGISKLSIESNRLAFFVLTGRDLSFSQLAQAYLGYDSTQHLKNTRSLTVFNADISCKIFTQLKNKLEDENLQKPYELLNGAQWAVAQVQKKYPNLRFQLKETTELIGTFFETDIQASEGRRLIKVEYKDLEMEVAGYISGDNKMLSLIYSDQNIYELTGAAIFEGDLQRAKEFYKKLIYSGMLSTPKKGHKFLSYTFPVFLDWLRIQVEDFNLKFKVVTPAGRTIRRNFAQSGWRGKICSLPIKAGATEVLQATLCRLKEINVAPAGIHNYGITLEVTQDETTESVIRAFEQGFLDIFPGGAVAGSPQVNLERL